MSLKVASMNRSWAPFAVIFFTIIGNKTGFGADKAPQEVHNPADFMTKLEQAIDERAGYYSEHQATLPEWNSESVLRDLEEKHHIKTNFSPSDITKPMHYAILSAMAKKELEQSRGSAWHAWFNFHIPEHEAIINDVGIAKAQNPVLEHPLCQSESCQRHLNKFRNTGFNRFDYLKNNVPKFDDKKKRNLEKAVNKQPIKDL